MITYTRQGDEVILQMSIADWEQAIFLLAFAAGGAKAVGDEVQFWRCIKFANQLNRTNPAFTPYEIPEAFR